MQEAVMLSFRINKSKRTKTKHTPVRTDAEQSGKMSCQKVYFHQSQNAVNRNLNHYLV